MSDQQLRMEWAKYAAKVHAWPNGALPQQRLNGEFVTGWHESEFQSFRAGFQCAEVVRERCQ